MKRTIYLTFVSVLTALSAVAQEPPREVVVTRDYEPDVSTFQKLDFAPRDLDTAALQPDMDYSIKPVPLTPNMPLHVAEPEKMDIAQRVIRYPYYLRAGLGLPIRSVVDFYATADDIEEGFACYFNHDGNYASLKNDAGINRSAMVLRNEFGVYVYNKTKSYDGYFLANYIGNIYSPYGQFTPKYLTETGYSSKLLQYHQFGIDMLISGNLEEIDYSARLRMYPIAGSYDAGDLDSLGYMDFDGSLRFKLGEGTMSVGLPIDFEINYEFRLGIVSKYELKVLDRINVGLGTQLIYSNYRISESRLHFYPIVEANMMVQGAKLSVSWTGELGNSSVRALVEQNPYLNAGSVYDAENSSLNRFKANVSGNVAQRVTYDVFAGADIWRDYIYFVSQPSGLFDVRNADVVNNYYIGAALGVQPFVGLELSADGRYNYFDPMPEIGTAIPRWQAGLKAKYSYRNRFFVGLGADFLGERRFATADTDDISGLGIDVIKNSINLSADIEARISRSVNVFVRGENLLNQRIETFNHYFIPGASVIAGVKIVF